MSERKAVAKVWTFQSSSNGKVTHETLQYVDGSTSCGCPGWTKRVDRNGARTCKHTRLVHQGLADRMAISMVDYAQVRPAPEPKPKQTAVTIGLPRFGRKLAI